jgi:hypothetical protein
MRLVQFTRGRLRHVCVAARNTAAQIEHTIRQHVREDGTINTLCLDFGGAYVPLAHVDEVRLAAELLAAHHGTPHTTPALSTGATEPWAFDAASDKYILPPSPEYLTPRQTTDWDADSDSADEKENQIRLAWDFEQNADIDATPNFGKTGIKLW